MIQGCGIRLGARQVGRIASILLVATILVLPAAAAENGLWLHVVDLGQGSGVVLQTDDAVVVFDAGQYGAMADYLSAIGIARIDLAIASHAHADHIGGFPAVMEAAAINRIWYNGQTHTTLTFERFVDAVLDSDAVYHEPARGETAVFGELQLTVLHPEGSAADYTGHLHEMNIMVLAEYRDVRVLLTGDAEAATEQLLIEAGVIPPAAVLQLGHHGSRTSTSPELLQTVQPEIVVYQAGENNRYGHPHKEVLSRLREMPNLQILGTDTHGTIVVYTDGRELTVTTKRRGQQ